MYLNLAAAWKDLAQSLEDDSFTEGELEMCRRAFYCGAHATMHVQTNIMEAHEKKPALILLRALQDEAYRAVHDLDEQPEELCN